MQNHALKSNKSRNKFILCIESATIQIVYGKREFYHIAQLENDLNVVAPETVQNLNRNRYTSTTFKKFTPFRS